jgi:serine/threonine protein kinase
MLDKRMIAKIVDFGTSRLMMPDSNGDTETSMTANIGTPGCNAPEVISADKLQQYSPKVDVFSFGVLAWACVTCEHPFASQHGRCWDIQADILDGKRPPITAAFDDFPSHLRSLTESFWHGTASQRPPFTQIEIRLMCGHRVEQATDFSQADEQLGNDHSSQVDDAAAPKGSENSVVAGASGRGQYPTFDPAEDTA